jgi:adenylate kinase
MTFIVTGTPGTGKTTYAKQLAKQKGYAYVDVNVFAKEHGFVIGRDEQRDADIVDERKLAKALDALLKKDERVVLDGHLSHAVSPKHVEACIVMTCDLKELRKRLAARGYSEKKVKENLEAQIMHVCEEEARQAGHSIILVSTDPKGI